jgi:ribosomal protein L11 methyltransferase
MAARAPKTYAKAEFHVRAALADDAAAILVRRGALGCAVKGNLVRRRALSVVVLQAFFERLSKRGLGQLERTLASSGMLAHAAPAGLIQPLVDPGWSTLWQSRFKPLKVGRRFFIVPPWSRVSDPARLRIVIEPGQAFGTGHHATTSSALRALEIECSRRRIRSALDVGSGSGVLAIGMKLLGVDKVVGIDVAPEAIAEARRNAELNRLSGAIRFSLAGLSAFKGSFDLIAANISFKELSAAPPAFKRLLAAGGSLILSGILRREAGPLLERYRPHFRCLRETVERGWATLVLEA